MAEAKADSAEADRKQTAALLGYTKIKAPFDGVITRRNVDAGWLVQVPAGSAPAAPLFVETRMDTVRVFMDVPEADAAQVADGMPRRCACRRTGPGVQRPRHALKLRARQHGSHAAHGD